MHTSNCLPDSSSTMSKRQLKLSTTKAEPLVFPRQTLCSPHMMASPYFQCWGQGSLEASLTTPLPSRSTSETSTSLLALPLKYTRVKSISSPAWPLPCSEPPAFLHRIIATLSPESVQRPPKLQRVWIPIHLSDRTYCLLPSLVPFEPHQSGLPLEFVIAFPPT